MLKRLCQHLLTALCVAFFLSACGSIGQTAPQTPEDNLRYGQAILTGVYATLSSSVTSGAMTGPQARAIFVKLEPADATLKSADTVCRQTPSCTLPTTIQGDIQGALTILTAVTTQLQAMLPASQTTKLAKLRAPVAAQ